jgi:hypothetical protein
MEWIDEAIARQWHCKHVSTAVDKHAPIEDVMFSVQSLPRLYNKDQLDNWRSGES